MRSNNYWVILLTFITAFVLAILPLPDWAASWRPTWVLLVLIYWCLALPSRVSVGSAWFLGILLDVMQGTLLGQHAIGFSIAAYVTIKVYRRVRVYPLYQQAFFIGMLVTFHLSLIAWINGITGKPPQSWAYLSPVLTSMLIWPWVFIILRDVRRKAKVA